MAKAGALSNAVDNSQNSPSASAIHSIIVKPPFCQFVERSGNLHKPLYPQPTVAHYPKKLPHLLGHGGAGVSGDHQFLDSDCERTPLWKSKPRSGSDRAMVSLLTSDTLFPEESVGEFLSPANMIHSPQRLLASHQHTVTWVTPGMEVLYSLKSSCRASSKRVDEILNPWGSLVQVSWPWNPSCGLGHSKAKRG